MTEGFLVLCICFKVSRLVSIGGTQVKDIVINIMTRYLIFFLL